MHTMDTCHPSFDSPPRIILIHNAPSPYRLPLFEELANHVDLTVLFCTRSLSNRKWNPELDEFDFNYEILGNFTVGDFIVNHTLYRRIREIDFDVCVVGADRRNLLGTLTALNVCTRQSKPVVIWAGHIEPEVGTGEPPFYKKIKRYFSNSFKNFLYTKATTFVAYSPMTETYLRNRGVVGDDIFIGGQVMPKENIPDRAKNRQNTDKFVFLYLGYLREAKGVDYLIDAFIQTDIEDSILRIAGSGPYEDQLRKRTANNANIEFVGHVHGEEKAACYDMADVFVLPTLGDSWGLVINEALYFNLPVITTEAAGAKHLVRETESGMVIDPADSDELSSALKRIYDDENFRKKCAENASKERKSTSPEYGIKPFLQAIRCALRR